MTETILWFLFSYASYAFVRIGQLKQQIDGLHKATDEELAEIWRALKIHVANK